VEYYADRNPGIIRPLLHRTNVGMHRNAQAVLTACRGEFIANLEGDDYWLHPEKLARQVAALDANPLSSASVHVAEIIDGEGRRLGKTPPGGMWPASIDLAYIVVANHVPTASLIFRRNALPCAPTWAEGLYMGDWPALVELVSKGSIQAFPDCWSVYRAHGAGAWSGATADRRLRAVVDFYDRVELHFPAAQQTRLAEIRKTLLLDLMHRTDAAGDRTGTRRWLRRYFASKPNRWQLPANHYRIICRALTGWPRHPFSGGREEQLRRASGNTAK